VYKVDAQYAGGSTLRQAFGKEIEDGDDAPTRRAKIEKQLQRYARGEHTTWQWLDDTTLEVTHRLPAVRTQPSTGLPTLFTGLAAYYRRLKQNYDNKAVAVQYYGDGTRLKSAPRQARRDHRRHPRPAQVAPRRRARLRQRHQPARPPALGRRAGRPCRPGVAV
jgi:hypothetical protein